MVSQLNLKNVPIISVFFISILMLLIFAIGYRFGLQWTVIEQQNNLLKFARERIKKVNEYVQNRDMILNVLIENKNVYEAFNEKNDLSKNEQLKTLITTYSEANDFKNILLINNSGKIIFSEIEKEKFSINLLQSPYNTTHLGRSYAQTMMSLTMSISSFEFDYILREQTLYIIKPIFFNQMLKGFIAAQINPEFIYKITHNYFDLGVTGEVILGEAVKNGTRIIAPTRHIPYQLIETIESTSPKIENPLHEAVLGQEGKGIGFDHRGIKTINGWGYLPVLGWGLVIKVDYSEVENAFNWLYYLIYGVLIISIITGIIVQKNTQFFSRIFSYINVKLQITVGFFCTTLCIFGLLIAVITLLYQYRILKHETIQDVHAIAETKVNNASEEITKELNQVIVRVQSIAEDLSLGRLKKEDIVIRMERDLKENPVLFGLAVAYAPYTYDATKKLYAPRSTKNEFKNNTIKTSFVEASFDYTSQDKTTASWYQMPMTQNKPFWLDAGKDVLTNAFIIRYAAPFYDVADKNKEKPIGVVVGDYNIESLDAIAQKLVIGETGYAFVLSKEGHFMYHPHLKLVTEGATIFDIAQQQNNKGLYMVAQKIMNNQSGKEYYQEIGTLDTIWVHFNNIPQVQWSLGLVFSEKEITASPEDIRHMRMWILSLSVLLALLISFQVCRIIFTEDYILEAFAIASSLIFLIALVILIFIIYYEPVQIQKGKEAIISNETSLKAFLNEQQLKAQAHYEQLSFIPTGILLHSITFPDNDHISFTGYVWQKYDVKDKSIIRGFQLPEATTYGSYKLSIEQVYYNVTGDVETIGWKVSATLRQYYDYSEYPFDRHRATIQLAPKDQKHTIMLIPAFSDYRDINNGKLLGFDTETSIDEFIAQKSFFSYVTTLQAVSYDDIQEVASTKTMLEYHILLIRGLLNAFIIYIVPILVILFSLYVVFYKITDTGTAIASYTGLLFALIVLHGNLRNNYNIGGFLYIEYLFFLAYVTLFLFIIHVLAWTRKEKADYLTKILRLFFWPVQFACWFIATLIVFYY
jgi:hypothetical protein